MRKYMMYRFCAQTTCESIQRVPSQFSDIGVISITCVQDHYTFILHVQNVIFMRRFFSPKSFRFWIIIRVFFVVKKRRGRGIPRSLWRKGHEVQKGIVPVPSKRCSDPLQYIYRWHSEYLYVSFFFVQIISSAASYHRSNLANPRN